MKTPTETTGDSSALVEAAVLGACLLAPWHFGKVAEVVTPEDLSNRANREIFSALLRLHGRGVPPDSVLVTAELLDTGKRSVVQTVGDVLKIGVVPAHLQFYVERLLERSKARRKAIELVQSSSNVIEPVES